MPNFSNKNTGSTCGRVSKIDENCLGHSFIKLSRKYPGKSTKIATLLTEELRQKGVKDVIINAPNVIAYKEAKNVTADTTEIIAEMTQELQAKDTDEAIEYHNEMFQAERKAITSILENKEIPEHVKLNQIQKVYNGSLGRTLDSLGYGKQNNVNVQVNFMQDKAREFFTIIKEEFNGQSDEIIEVIKRRLLANGR